MLRQHPGGEPNILPDGFGQGENVDFAHLLFPTARIAKSAHGV
jgi:hypothetical protein